MLIAPVLMVDVVMADKIVVTTQMKSNAVILLIFTGNRRVYKNNVVPVEIGCYKSNRIICWT